MHYFFENRSQKTKNHIPLSIYANDNFSYHAHWHTEFELALVESGSIWVGINNHRRKLVAGDLAISTSGDIHYYESNDPDSRIIILVFKPEFFGLAADWPDNRQLSSAFFTNKAANQQIRTIIYSILAESNNQKQYYELFIKAKVIELCGSILRHLPSQPLEEQRQKNFAKQKALQDILLYIEKNFTEDISLDLLAKKFNMDSYNLSKSFNSVTGNSLRRYINNLRITKAEHLIQNTNKPMIDIAFECGFNSVRTFNRVYKNLTGHVPSAQR